MRLTLTRVERTARSTLGDLAIDGEFFCYTLEDPVRPEGIKIPGTTAIPAGVYPVQITWSPRFRQDMPLLIGVPNFTGVRIHPGNTADHTEGCVLVGYERHPDEIRRSRDAYNDLLFEIQAAREAGEDVLIEILNQYESA
jgi:Family of unknown function (DUF5675)